jgi:acetyltransferase-like isoleucine patch superfamily enzyme
MSKRSLLERLYRSRLGRIISFGGWALARLQRPFMVYGYRDPASGEFRKYTRMSSDVIIMNRKDLAVGDHVWVWHHSIIDATAGLEIQEGCQVGAWVGIFTHGSENAIRLLGEQFVHIHNTERMGYTRGQVKIGAYTFIGAGSIVLPGVTIGKGCLIGARTLVTNDIPDYSIAVGAPARVIGTTIDLDMKLFHQYDYSKTYYDPEALDKLKSNLINPNEPDPGSN